MPHTRFRVNLYSIVAWMSKNSLLSIANNRFLTKKDHKSFEACHAQSYLNLIGCVKKLVPLKYALLKYLYQW